MRPTFLSTLKALRLVHPLLFASWSQRSRDALYSPDLSVIVRDARQVGYLAAIRVLYFGVNLAR